MCWVWTTFSAHGSCFQMHSKTVFDNNWFRKYVIYHLQGKSICIIWNKWKWLLFGNMFEIYKIATSCIHLSLVAVMIVEFWMMTSSNGNIFRVTGHLCRESTGPRWIPHTKASDAELWCLLRRICSRINGWVNNREAGDLRRHRTRYDVIVMVHIHPWCHCFIF